MNIEKDFPDEIEKLEEALNTYISENDLKILKSEFPDKWNYLRKLPILTNIPIVSKITKNLLTI